jgi:hypothetical protein
MRVAAAILAFAAILGVGGSARGHEFRPCLLDIRDAGGGRFESAWQVPSGGPTSSGEPHVSPVFPAHCSVTPLVPGASRALIDCGAGGLAGHPIAVRGLGGAHPDALVRFLARDGSVVATSVLRADHPKAVIPAAFGASTSASPSSEARGAVFKSYFGAGVEHILLGLDHLLFVLGLLLLVKRTQAPEARSPTPAPAPTPAPTPNILKAITAFTLAHSVTLGMAALHVVRVPGAPVEAVIALSLVFLARELARIEPEPRSLTQRRPWLVALLFGLLHGFGFAGGLAELGVPDSQVPIALAAFNLGVEAGQIAFVAAALALLALLALVARTRRAVREPPAWAARAPAYLLGPIAVAFFLQRVLALLDLT